jgi:hypothetical protein
MSNASLELGGGNWAAKVKEDGTGNLLGYAVGDTSGKYLPREFTFSRGADIGATRVNKDGLIEKYRENLLLQSNQFDTTWYVADATATSGQTGYDGTGDAWLFTTTVAGASLEQSITASGVVVFSMYAKKGTVDGIRLRIDAATDANAYFNLSSGSVHSFTGSAIDASITDLGGGWHRCEVSANISSPVKVAVYTTDGTTAYDNGNIYIQDAQLEYGLVATDYLESGASTGKAGILDNLPRIDYTGGSASLLLEPERKNEISHSEYGGGYETVDSNVTVTDNAEVSPEGLKNAVKIEGISTSSATQAVKFGALESGSVVGRTFTGSLYIKPVNSGDVGGNVYLSIQRRFGDFEASTEAIEIDSADWKRYEITYTFTGAGSGNQIGCDFKILKSGTPIDDIYVYGVQLEEGSYPTSYIPTYGVSATRNSDNINRFETSALGFGTTCSAYFEGIIGEADALYIRPITMFDSSVSTSERFLLFAQTFSGSTYTLTSRHSSGGATYDLNKTGITIGEKVKCVSVFDGTSHKFFFNGSSVGTNTVAAAEIFEYLDLSNILADQNHTIDNIKIYPVALSDSECIALTTL